MSTAKKPVGGEVLGATLFGQTRRRVLGLILSRPDQSFYLREIVRHTGAAQGAVQRELQLLTAAGVLARSATGRLVYYRANPECPIASELRAIVTKTSGLVDVLRSALTPLQGAIEVAFVFGSMARLREKGSSDVDLFVVGQARFGEVVEALSAIEGTLGREVNPVVRTRAEFNAQVNRNDHFITSVLRSPLLFVMGGEHELGDMANQRLAGGAPVKPSGNRRPAESRRARPARQQGHRRQR